MQTGHIVEIYGSHSREESRSCGVSRRELRVGAKGPRQAGEERLGRRAWGDKLGMKPRKKGRAWGWLVRDVSDVRRGGLGAVGGAWESRRAWGVKA